MHSFLPKINLLFLLFNIIATHISGLDKRELSKHVTKKNYLRSIPKLYGTENQNTPPFSWSNVVIFMLTYNNHEADKLLQAQFDTWIKRINDPGLDIVVVTDSVDTRESRNILPDIRHIKPTVHLYRSPAPNEGNKARAKTVDAFRYCLEDKFGSNPNKLYYVKVDPDQFIITQRFEGFLDEVHRATYGHPADFGNVNCNNKAICYTMGGLYGMSRAGLLPWVKYLQHNKSIYNDFIPSNVVSDRNLVLHEDFFTSYVLHKATNYPTITDPRIGLMNLNPVSPKTKEPPAVISFHPIKNVHDIYVMEKIFYDSRGNIRSNDVAKELFDKFKDMFDFTKMVWDYQLGKMVYKT